MPKSAISVTLDADNLTWLKARAGSGQARSVSDLLDRIVTDARTRGAGGGVKSVVGTIDVDPSDLAKPHRERSRYKRASRSGAVR